MDGVAYILIAVCLFIHLGLGDTLCKMIHYEFVLFKCVKCATFWSVLCYTIFVLDYPIPACLAISFGSAYVSLWVSLLLSKLAEWYEKLDE